MEKKTKFSVWYVVTAILGVLILQNYIALQFTPRIVSYSEFLKVLQDGQVTEAVVTEGRITGKMKVTEAGEAKEIPFATYRVDADISDELDKHNVKFRGLPESTLLRDLFSWMLPALIFFGIWYFLMKRFSPGAGMMSFRGNKAKVYAEKELTTRFEDVAGADELAFGDVSTGAHSDLQRATDIARAMVSEYGRGKTLGLSYPRQAQPLFLNPQQMPVAGKEYSEATAARLDEEVKELITERAVAVKQVLSAKQPLLEAIARELLRSEVMEADVFYRLVEAGRLLRVASRRFLSFSETGYDVIGSKPREELFEASPNRKGGSAMYREHVETTADDTLEHSRWDQTPVYGDSA